jgi:hypothetical protein
MAQTAFAAYAPHGTDAQQSQGKRQKKKNERLRDKALNHWKGQYREMPIAGWLQR